MDSLVTELNHWHWFAFGVLLIVVEVFVSGALLMWMGFAAMAVGVLVWLMPGLTWETQIMFFAGASIISIYIWRQLITKKLPETDQPTLNRRAEQYVGRVFTLEEPLVNGQGKIHVDDSTWKITGDDLPVGAKVKVVSVAGVILHVETAE